MTIMKDVRCVIEAKIKEMYKENSPYILKDYAVNAEIRSAERFSVRGERKMVDFCVNEALEAAELFNRNRLSPVTVKVGDGVTVHLWSDAYACTILKITKCSITVQRDKATLNPDFKPEFIIGGFAAHCTNQDEQSYTYEPNPNGAIEVYRWSNKHNCYQGGGDGSIKLTKGRHEFYDYNF